MAIARFEMPDGRIARFEVPDGISPAQAQAMISAQLANSASPMSFGETGGGAATGRPINRGQLNVDPTPRPTESFLAGVTKSAVDLPLGAAQMLTGGNLGTSKAAQRLSQQADVYQQENPIAYGTGRVAGVLAPSVGAANVIGAIPSFAKASPLVQNIGMGSALGAISSEETGKTGSDLYANQLKNALIGGTVGAAVTPLQKLVGLLRGPKQSEQMAKAVETARGAGYVIPPTQAKGSLINRALEGTSGKAATAQNASARNQEVTNKLAAKALGLPEDQVISKEVLENLRTDYGKTYDAVAKLPVKPEVLADSTMNRAAIPEINPKKMVYDLRVARKEADAYYNAYKRSADPEHLSKAQAAKAQASEIESTLENYAKSIGQDDLVPAMQEARKAIAKTYTVENALNDVSGNVSSKALGKALTKGKPLDEELKTAAEFGIQFPRANQSVESMGSLPQTSPLDIMAAGAASTLSPAAWATLGVRPAARYAALSDAIQNKLVQNPVTTEQSALARMLLLKGLKEPTEALIEELAKEE